MNEIEKLKAENERLLSVIETVCKGYDGIALDFCGLPGPDDFGQELRDTFTKLIESQTYCENHSPPLTSSLPNYPRDCGCPPNTLCGGAGCPRAIKVTCNAGEWVMEVTTQKESE